MTQGHIIEIHEDFDHDRQCFTARVELKEFRQGRQYGGTVVFEHSQKTYTTHDAFMRSVTELVKKEVLSLLTFKMP